MEEIIYNSNYESKSNPKELKINEQDIENQLINKFFFLKEEEGLHKNYSSFDFRENEKFMVENWKKILDFLFKKVFDTCGMKMSDLLKYTVIKNKVPTGLNNIIQQLRIEQKYVTDSDLKDEKFYNINFPELYPQQAGYVSSLINGVKSIINFAGTKMGCGDENNNESDLKIRTDISEKEKYSIIPENSIIFNYHEFSNYCSSALEVLKDILHERDEEEVIPKRDFIKIVNERYVKKSGIIGERISLIYDTQYIDYALYYLKKLKKIDLFKVELNSKNIECIKLFKNQNDTVSEKDIAVAKILIHIELLQKRMNEFTQKIDKCDSQARENLKKGNKQGAKDELLRKKKYQKFLLSTQNSHSVLENQIFDLRNAQNNVSVTNVLKQCVEVGKQIGINPDEFAEVSEDIKEQKDNLNEINNNMNELVDEEDKEYIDKEMEQLEKETVEEIKLPNPNTENLDENKIFEGLGN